MNSQFLRAELRSPSSNKNSNAFKPTQPTGDQRAIHFIDLPANQDRILKPQPLLRSIPIKSGVLNSWKEIATYLGRGVRTVQRWEAELQLPVHRPRGRTRSAVLAFRQELDDWLQCTPSQGDSKEIGNALLDIAHDMQTLARQLFTSANFQTRCEGENLVEAAGTIVQRLNLLMNGNPKSTNFERNSSPQGRSAMKKN